MNRTAVASELVMLAKALVADDVTWNNEGGKFTDEQIAQADRLFAKAKLDQLFVKLVRKAKVTSWTPGSRKGFMAYPENIIMFTKVIEEFGWQFADTVAGRKIYRNADSDIVIIVFGREMAFFAVA
jgi:hypothetical protein